MRRRRRQSYFVYDLGQEFRFISSDIQIQWPITKCPGIIQSKVLSFKKIFWYFWSMVLIIEILIDILVASIHGVHFLLSVQFSRSVVSDSLRPHESQHARPPCPSPTPAVYSNSCPSSRWCHQAISSSAVPFSSCPQSLPASGSFPVSQLFGMRWPKYWSFSFSISPSNEHPGLTSFRIDWLDLPAVQGTLKSLLQHHSSKASIFRRSAFFTVQQAPQIPFCYVHFGP